MPTFSPPTVPQGISGDRLFSRYTIPVGQSVVQRSGTYYTVPYPALREVAHLEEGVEWFLGGHIYDVSDEVAEALIADGYQMADELVLVGYGIGRYGYGRYSV